MLLTPAFAATSSNVTIRVLSFATCLIPTPALKSKNWLDSLIVIDNIK
jgi:hypothetical protein